MFTRSCAGVNTAHKGIQRLFSQSAVIASGTLGQLVDAQAHSLEHRDAYRNARQNVRWTYTELKTCVDAAAVGFRDLRLKPGDTFVNALVNDPENMVNLLAAAKVGARMLAIEPNWTQEAADRALTAVNARALFFTPSLGKRDNFSEIEKLIPELIRTPYGMPLRSEKYRNLVQPVHTAKYESSLGTMKYMDLPVYDPMPSPLPDFAKQISSENVLLSNMDANGNISDFTHSDLLGSAKSLAQELGLGLDKRVYIAGAPQSSYNHVAFLAALDSGAFAATYANHELNDTETNALIDDLAVEQCSTLIVSAPLAGAIANSSKLTHANLSHLKRIIIVDDVEQGSVASEFKEPLAEAIGASVQLGIAAPGVCGLPVIDGKAISGYQARVVNAKGKACEEGILEIMSSSSQKWAQTGANATSSSGAVSVV